MPFDLSENNGNAEKGVEAQFEEHAKAIQHLKEKSEFLKDQQNYFAEQVEETFKLLRARITDVYAEFKRETKAAEESADRHHRSVNTEIQTLYDRQDQDHDSLVGVEEALNWVPLNDTTDKLTSLIENLDLHIKSAIELLREKDITSEETTKVYETLLQMLTQNSNEAKGLHNQELGKQFDRLAVKTKKCIWEQASCKAGVEDIQARLETYAQENQSLKEKVDEQEATITALKEDNCNFKMQIGSLLFSTRMMAAKMDRLSAEVRNLDKFTE